MIRRAIRADLRRISEIRGAVRENRLLDPTRVTAADVDWFLDGPGIWVWDEGGRIDGFSAADTRDGTVWALFVDPGREGRGVGRALFAKACEILAGTEHAVWSLGTEPGSRAARFYAAQGWTAEGVDGRGEMVFRRVAREG